MADIADHRHYPQGVPSWVDLEVPDPASVTDFYGRLFGWEFHEAVPPGAPGSYLIATLDGHDVAAIAPAAASVGRWNTYVACDSADSSAALVRAAGGRVVQDPLDAGPAGRWAECADPDGAVFRLWQARHRLGAQLVNAPGAWNFSVLITPRPADAITFYGEVFGWEVDADLGAGMVRLPGYGDHLAATVDPDIRERQSSAPPGFADVVAGAEAREGEPRWEVRFAVQDRDASAEIAEQAGGTVVSRGHDEWTKGALIRDPSGGEFAISQFDPE